MAAGSSGLGAFPGWIRGGINELLRITNEANEPITSKIIALENQALEYGRKLEQERDELINRRQQTAEKIVDSQINFFENIIHMNKNYVEGLSRVKVSDLTDDQTSGELKSLVWIFRLSIDSMFQATKKDAEILFPCHSEAGDMGAGSSGLVESSSSIQEEIIEIRRMTQEEINELGRVFQEEINELKRSSDEGIEHVRAMSRVIEEQASKQWLELQRRSDELLKKQQQTAEQIIDFQIRHHEKMIELNEKTKEQISQIKASQLTDEIKLSILKSIVDTHKLTMDSMQKVFENQREILGATHADPKLLDPTTLNFQAVELITEMTIPDVKES